jgi:hypothetical protein
MTSTVEAGTDILLARRRRRRPRGGRAAQPLPPRPYVPKTLTRSLPWCSARYSALSALLSSSSCV